MSAFEPHPRLRPTVASGRPSRLHGEYRLSAQTGLVTTAAAATATAGHLFVMRNASATKRLVVRHIRGQFVCTTAFGAAQAMGLDAIVARSFSVSYTGGTAIDLSGNAAKLRADQETSVIAANACRIATTAGLTAGTQTLDANAIAGQTGWIGAAGALLDFTLLDARDDGGAAVRSPLELGQNEGLVLRNLILMGASGVGIWTFTVEWDEVTP